MEAAGAALQMCGHQRVATEDSLFDDLTHMLMEPIEMEP